MTAVTIPHSRDDARTIVKAAFEDSQGIKTYHDDGIRIVGKTGASIGLIKSSYGEQVIVEIPEEQPSKTETMVSVTGQKEVDMNIGANPEKYVSQVIESINSLKNESIDDILDVLQSNHIDRNTKEVDNIEEQASGSWMLIVVLIFIFIFIFMPLLMI